MMYDFVNMLNQIHPFLVTILMMVITAGFGLLLGVAVKMIENELGALLMAIIFIAGMISLFLSL